MKRAFPSHQPSFGPERGAAILDLFSIGRAIAAFDSDMSGEFAAVAGDIQRSLLDVRVPPVPGVEIGVRAAPGRLVGGDYLDVIPRRGMAPLFGIGEVSGRSLPSALKSLGFKYAVRGIVAAGSENLAHVLDLANLVVGELLENDEYVSALLFTLPPTLDRLVLANAGHDPPLVHRARTGLVEETPTGGLVLGVQDDTRQNEQEIALEPGDTAVFYTDGFTDARNAAGEPFQLAAVKAGLLELVSRDAQALADALFAQIDAFTIGTYRDDASLLVVRLRR